MKLPILQALSPFAIKSEIFAANTDTAKKIVMIILKIIFFMFTS